MNHMRLTILGAMGGTGEALLSKALKDGHEVTALVRDPENLAVGRSKVRVIKGEVTDEKILPDAIGDADAVLSALGKPDGSRRTTVYSESARAVTAAMNKTGVRRLIAVSAVSAQPDEFKGLFSKYVVHPILHRFFGAGYEDMRRMEAVLQTSDVDWTVFRAPRLTDDAPGMYRIAIDAPLPRAVSLPHASLAWAMLAGIDDETMVRHAVTIAK
jgi:putative NADH-flavin reductase